MRKSANLITLDDFIDREYGKRGSAKREKFEQGYEEFKLVALALSAGSFGFTRIVFSKYCCCWKWGVRGVLRTKNVVENVIIKGRVNYRRF